MNKLQQLSLLFLLSSGTCMAKEVNFSAGTGWPYFINTEVSYRDNNGGVYLSAGIGVDTGIAAGWETVVSADKKHALGLVVGAVGIKDSPDVCEQKEDPLEDVLNNVFVCPLINIFDETTLNGVGASYSYSFSGYGADSGWQLRLVAGYGEGNRDVNGATGSAYISYRF